MKQRIKNPFKSAFICVLILRFRILGLGFCKQQKTLCLRGLRVRKMVVWDGV